MKPIRIVCFRYGNNRYNLSNLGLNTIFSWYILALQKHRELDVYLFDAFDPAKIGLTKEEDWSAFAQKTKEVMVKVLGVEITEMTHRESKEYVAVVRDQERRLV